MQVRDVVDVVTSDPPPLRYGVDDIVASGQRVQRRRRLIRATSGAAAVVVALGAAVAVTVPALSESSNGTGTSAATTAGAPAIAPGAPVGPFTFTVNAYKVGKLSVATPVSVSTAYELAPVYADGLTSNDRPVDPSTVDSEGPDKTDPNFIPDPDAARNLSAYLTVYRPGAYDPTKLAGSQPVTVGGRPGLSTTVTGGPWAMVRTLAWQYADNAWAVLVSRSDQANYPSADELRDLAAGLRTDARTVAKLPVKLGYVPAGYSLTEVGVRAMAGPNGIASARAGDYGGLLFSNPALPTTGLTEPFTGPAGGNPAGSFAVFIVPAKNSNQSFAPGVTCMNGFCNRWFDEGRVKVQVSGDGLLPDSEMTRILESVTLANVQDEGTWVSP